MKKLCTLLALVLLLSCMPMSGCTAEPQQDSAPQPNPASDFEYAVNDLGAITIQKYIGTADEAIIPREIEGKEVVTIGSRAFENSTVRTILLPDTLKSIGERAFLQCTALESIDLSMSSMTQIGKYAFYGCSALRNVTFGDNITRIADYAFYKCISLEKAHLPKSLTTLGTGAFAYCTWLRSVTIPKTLTEWGTSVFKADYSLLELNLEDGLQSIGVGAFMNCASLPSVTLPASITSVGSQAFSSTSALWDVIFEGDAPTIGTNAFSSAISYVPYLYYSPDTSGWDTVTLSESHRLLPIAERENNPNPMNNMPSY